MNIEQDLAIIEQQEEQLRFEHFSATTAWELGSRIKALAESKTVAMAIDIRLGEHLLFYHAMQGTTPDNKNWIRRKRNLCAHFQRSSYKTALKFEKDKTNPKQKFGLSYKDYALAGGSFPILLPLTGYVGSITVSGSTGREDHNLVAEAIAGFLNRPFPNLSVGLIKAS